MPLEQLKTYKGRNPRPADFDEFWDKSLAELDAIDPNPTFTPADFTCSFAELYELRFTSTKGARIYAKYLRPKNVTAPRPAVVHFHGLSGSFGEWMQLLPWVAEGYVVAAMDCRGQGGHSEDVGGAPAPPTPLPLCEALTARPRICIAETSSSTLLFSPAL
jgi:cephalosporin-C deacetylase